MLPRGLVIVALALSLLSAANGQLDKRAHKAERIAYIASFVYGDIIKDGQVDVSPRSQAILKHVQKALRHARINYYEVGLGTQYFGVRLRDENRARRVLKRDCRLHHYALDWSKHDVEAWD